MIMRSTIFSVVILFPESTVTNLFIDFGIKYGSSPFMSIFTGVFPWHTTSTWKCFIKSVVTLYGAPITTSETY